VRRLRAKAPAVAAALLALGGGAAAAGYPVYVSPDVDEVSAARPADAVVALGGEVATAWVAYDLAAEGAAEVVVISDPYGDVDTGFIDGICAGAPPRPEVVCFDPRPRTTRGEARFVADLAERRGWDRVAVMTPTYHVARAEYVVGRCTDAELAMVDAGLGVGAGEWAYQYAYQTAGWLRAWTQRGC
jgi:uncharacterized SAM-binding protein YcdF (DUF218 family)